MCNKVQDLYDTNGEITIYHTTAIIDSVLNPHIHLCAECFRISRIVIPTLYTKEIENKEETEL